MGNINSKAGLQNAILLLEVEQASRAQLLKERFLVTTENLRPVNLIANTLKDISKSPPLMDNISVAVIGLITGYISRKIIIGGTGGIVRKLAGTIIQLGMTGLVAKNSSSIKSAGRYLFNKIQPKKTIEQL